MKKILLSSLAALTLSGAAYAQTLTLYTDPTTGQVFTKEGEGRVEMGDFIDAKSVYEENQAQDSAIAKKEAKKKDVPVFAKASKLKFSGVHYLGYRYRDNDIKSGESQFETRRNYIQVKAYLFDDPKSYMRVTLDTHQDSTGDWKVRLKYAYLYLNEVLPFTGIEFGQAHRPWLDYEEHSAWLYRSISKTFVETKRAGDLTNSADLGINFKTKTDYFTSEIGVYNGEGYHGEEAGEGVSLEWRLTAAILGEGKTKRKVRKTTYWDASFYGQYNMKNTSNGNKTYAFYGLHTVYNMPSFLIAGHYIYSDNDYQNDLLPNDANNYKHNGQGWSVNAGYRFGEDKEFELLGRYGVWTAKNSSTGVKYDNVDAIAGVAWEQNKNVTWVVNANYYDPKDGRNYKGSGSVEQYVDYMVTAEVTW